MGLPVALGQSDHQSCPLPGIGWRSINSLLLFKSLSLLLIGQESSTFSVNKGFVYNSLSEKYKNIARSLSCIIIKVWYNQGTKLGFKLHHCFIVVFSLLTGSRSILETNWCCIPVRLGSFWMNIANTKGILCNFAFHLFSCFKISSTWSRRLKTRELLRNVDHW